MHGAQVQDIGKMLVLVIIASGLIIGLSFGAFEHTELAWTALGVIVGYVTGNGVNALRGRAATSVLVPKVPEGEAVTPEGSFPATVVATLPPDPPDHGRCRKCGTKLTDDAVARGRCLRCGEVITP